MGEDVKSSGPREVATELVRLLSQSINGMAEVTSSVERLRSDQGELAHKQATQRADDHGELVGALLKQAEEQHGLAKAVREQTGELKKLMGALVERLPAAPTQTATDRNLNAQTALLVQVTKVVAAVATGAGGLWGAQHLLGG